MLFRSKKSGLEIISYLSKTLPLANKSAPILEMALLIALSDFEKYISNVPVKILTDSRVLYYIFNPKVSNSSLKIKRWSLKLVSDYPQVSLYFVKGTENLADFLTREYSVLEGDTEKICRKVKTVHDVYEYLPEKEMNFAEFKQWTEENPEFIEFEQNKKEVKGTVLAISKGLENIKSLTDPLIVLRELLSRENFVKQQKIGRAHV